MGVSYTDLETLLKTSDVISIHVPLTPETKHMIGERELAMIKTGSLLVNTSKGAVVDIRALVKHIDRIYVALDVLEGEEWLKKEKDFIKGSLKLPEEGLYAEFLRKHPNVIITPHIAYNTEEANKRRWMLARKIAKEIEEGKQPEYGRLI
jgi:phosphoglycerate dehydrogenase-like enzyme